MKFREMPYTRPDPEQIKSEYRGLTERLAKAQSYEEARAVFLEKEEKEKIVDTMAVLASVRHSIDTRDEFYDGEIEFWDWPTKGPVAGAKIAEMKRRIDEYFGRMGYRTNYGGFSETAGKQP